MSTTYATIGQSLYDLFEDIDITGIYAGGWADKANYPLKEPGKLTTWPVFSVQPSEDAEVDMDSTGDDALITYYVYLYDTFENSATTEAKMRQLVDLTRTTLRQEKRSSTPLGNGAYTLGDIAGSWGYDPDLGIRFYRFSIQTKTYEPTI